MRLLPFAAALAAGVLSACAAGTVLEIVREPEGQRVFCRRVQPGEEVILAYVHSVNRRPVYDTLRIEDGRLVIVKSRFDAFGAGMPDGSTDEGSLEVLAGGILEWRLDRPVGEVTLRVGRVADHRLLFREGEVSLDRLAPPGAALTLRPGRAERFDFLWKGRCSP
ncbi:MAG: DUF1850 domain-containing protein [Desulfobacterales bacterium]